MLSSRRRLTICGFPVALLYVMAVGTGVAQAEAGSKWQVKGSNVGPALLPAIQVTEVENKVMTLLFTTKAGTKVEMSCTGVNLEGFQLQEKGAVSTTGKTKFTGCETKLNGVLTKNCEPYNGAEKGVILSQKLKGVLLLHEGLWLVSLEASTGETLASAALGELCAVGETVSVTGKLTLKDPKFGEDAVTHLVSEGPLTKLLALGQPATPSGSVVTELAGEHQGMFWSASEAAGGVSWILGSSRVVATPLLPSVTINELDTNVNISATIPTTGTKIDVSCKGASLLGIQLKTDGSSSGFKIRFSECTLSFNGTVSKECEPHTGSEKGVIITNTLTALLVLSGGQAIVQVKPEEGETVAVYETKIECGGISESKYSWVLGTFTMKDSSLQTESVTHLATQGPSSSLTLWHNEARKLSATLTGGGVLSLTGAFTSFKWRGLPG